MSSSLPLPDANALATSRLLEDRIRAEIDAKGGWISFARFMELALYEPGLGYYSAGAAKLGADPRDGSDFTTAPELSPLFARALARPVAQVLAASAPEILEIGGGSGKLAADLLLELERINALPERYALLEVSADLRARQKAMLAARAPHLAARVVWLDALPERIAGAVIGNEVLDALPVQWVVRKDAGWFERGVCVDGVQAFAYLDLPAGAGLQETIAEELGSVPRLIEGYQTEIHGPASAFVATLVERMADDRTTAWFIDYGFPASEYYHPQRDQGTLMAHYRHRAHAGLLRWPGLQDLSAHVNFSAIASAVRAAGGEVRGYASQAAFLIDCGIAALLDGTAGDAACWAPQAAALQMLLSEAEMGELFKVIAIGRRTDAEPAEPADSPIGFGTSDRRDSL